VSESTPLVSVVMPVRDGQSYVEEAVESIRVQTLDSWELIAVDDGSTDRTPEILKAMAASDPRIRIVHMPRKGVAKASNHGFSMARSKLVARMDCDDVCLPRRLEAQLEYARANPDWAVVGCLVECFPRDSLTDGMRSYESWLNGLVEPRDIGMEMFVESPLANPGLLFRRDVFLEAGGFSEGPFPEDYDLLLRLHCEGRPMGKVPEVLLRWRDSEERLTRRDPRYSRNSFRRLKARHVARFWLRGADRVQVWGAGREGRLWRRALAREGVRVVRFFDVDPKKVGRTLGGEEALGGGAPILSWRDISSHRDLPTLCAVAVWGARAEIRQSLTSLGFVEGIDYLFVS